MGLILSFGCWEGSYSSFNEFRTYLAKKIGINYKEMKGFGGNKEWSEIEYNDLFPLLNHSDCEGFISMRYLEGIITELENILKTMNEEDKWFTEIDNFIRGSQSAIEEWTGLEFW